jgi:hypothetical protein
MAESGTANGTEDTAMARQQAAAAPEAPPAGAKKAGRPDDRRLGQGPGRLLLWFYGVFTVAALSRSIVQISTKFGEAPLAYVLSLAAGIVYAVITAALWRGGDQARKVALVSCSAELAGVIAVGVLTVADSSAFPDQTVWSDFGYGYVFLPLILPVMGLLWVRRAGRPQAASAAPEHGTDGGAAPRG